MYKRILLAAVVSTLASCGPQEVGSTPAPRENAADYTLIVTNHDAVPIALSYAVAEGARIPPVTLGIAPPKSRTRFVLPAVGGENRQILLLAGDDQKPLMRVTLVVGEEVQVKLSSLTRLFPSRTTLTPYGFGRLSTDHPLIQGAPRG